MWKCKNLAKIFEDTTKIKSSCWPVVPISILCKGFSPLFDIFRRKKTAQTVDFLDFFIFHVFDQNQSNFLMILFFLYFNENFLHSFPNNHIFNDIFLFKYFSECFIHIGSLLLDVINGHILLRIHSLNVKHSFLKIKYFFTCSQTPSKLFSTSIKK